MNPKTQSCCLYDLDTLKNCDDYYLLLKTSDKCVAFLFWQATECKIFLEQALQDIVQEYTIKHGDRYYISVYYYYLYMLKNHHNVDRYF